MRLGKKGVRKREERGKCQERKQEKRLQKYRARPYHHGRPRLTLKGTGRFGHERAASCKDSPVEAPTFPELASGWDSGQGSGNQGPAPEKHAQPLNWKSGQRFGLPARSSSGSEFRDSERGPHGSAKQRPHIPTPRELDIGCLQHAQLPTQAVGLQMNKSPLPFASELRG